MTRSGRVSKRVSNFEIPLVPADKKTVEKAEYKFDGPGVTLGSIPCAQYWITKTDSEDLKTLFKICFNRAGKNSEVKQMMRKYNGFNYPEDSKDCQARVNFIERLVDNSFSKSTHIEKIPFSVCTSKPFLITSNGWVFPMTGQMSHWKN